MHRRLTLGLPALGSSLKPVLLLCRYCLLAVAASLSPEQSLDENLVSQLRDKYADRMSRMQSNTVDIGAYEELFAFACPKFIAPAPPPYHSLPATYNPQEAYRLQLRLFLVRVPPPPCPPTLPFLLPMAALRSCPLPVFHAALGLYLRQRGSRPSTHSAQLHASCPTRRAALPTPPLLVWFIAPE